MITFMQNTQFENLLHLAVDRYLQDKSFLTKQEVLDIVSPDADKKVPSSSNNSKNINFQSTIGYFLIGISLKNKKLAEIVTSRMSLFDFLRTGFISYTFRSKYFWGFDPVFWSLGKYHVQIDMFVAAQPGAANRMSTNRISADRVVANCVSTNPKTANPENKYTHVILHSSKGPVKVLTQEKYRQLKFLYDRLFTIELVTLVEYVK